MNAGSSRLTIATFEPGFTPSLSSSGRVDGVSGLRRFVTIASAPYRSKDDHAHQPRRIGADSSADLRKLDEVKRWIEPNGAIWIVRPKGGRGTLRETDLFAAGLAAGLVDNKIASFSETHGAMRFVYRLRDRPK